VSDRWARYYAAAGYDARPTLLAALERFDDEPADRDRLAVDLGCGTGRDTIELLRRGWRVLAIDAEEEAIERLLEQKDVLAAADRLETAVADFESATWPPCDLVNGSFAFPFCPPEPFPAFWERVGSSLRPGGRVSGQLFGERDEWAPGAPGSPRTWSSPSAMTFHTRSEVEDLLRGYEVEQLLEIEEDGQTAIGEAKHWHLFHVVARIADR